MDADLTSRQFYRATRYFNTERLRQVFTFSSMYMGVRVLPVSGSLRPLTDICHR
jgi:hypothetical protein